MNKKLFFISFLLILVYCLSAVCAADVNSTGDNLEITEDSSFDLSYADEVYDNSSECDGNSDCVNSACDTLSAVSEDLSTDDDCLGAIEVHPPKLPPLDINGPIFSKDADYNELQRLVYKHSQVDLNRDYSINTDVPFNINNCVVFDGHGHTINFNGKSSPYVIKSICGNLVFKNLHICNGNCRDSGGAIFIAGSASLTVINCTFTGNKADKSGGAIFNANKNLLKVINSTFMNNHVSYYGGAVYSKSDVRIVNSIFRYNSADRNHGAVYADRLAFKDHSIAEFNYANKHLAEQVFSKTMVFDDSIFIQKFDFKRDISHVNLNQDSVNLCLGDSNDLDTLFKYIRDNNPSWQILNITLAPYTTYSAPNYINAYGGSSYAVRSNIGLFVINGNPGSVIQGKDNIFAFIPPNCNVAVNHVIFEDFKTCFKNNGEIYCANSIFNNIEELISNDGGACFDNCTFKIKDDHGNKVFIVCDQSGLTVLTECEYLNWNHPAMVASDCSSIVVLTKKPVENLNKWTDVGEGASFTVINIDKINETCTVFNCSNGDEFDKVVSTINFFRPNGQIIINLEPKVYSLKCDSKYILSSYSYLHVANTPMVINGNGATIKLDKNTHSFANIGLDGILSVKNVTFSDFACVFKNSGNLILSNCCFINDHKDYENWNFEGMILTRGGKSYVSGCNFKNKLDSFGLSEGAELYFSKCDFTNKGNIGSASDSIIYGPKEFMKKFKTIEGKENHYHYNDINMGNHTFNPKSTVVINVVNSNHASKLNDFLRNYTPSKIVLNISCDCGVGLEGFKSLEELTINGNGHKVLFKSSTIDEKLSVTINNLTFSSYIRKCLFENKGSMTFNNCCFFNNLFEKYLVNNAQGCTFQNCTFKNNRAEYLMYNEGMLLLDNCSFDNNKISGRVDGVPCLIYSKGVLLVSNSNFTNGGNQVLLNYNTDCGVLLNSSGINQIFKVVNPEPPKKEYKHKWLWFVVGAVVLVAGAVTGGIAWAAAATTYGTLAAIGIGIGVGFLVSIPFAVGGSFLASYVTGASVKVLLPIYLGLGFLGAVIGSLGAYAINSLTLMAMEDSSVELSLDSEMTLSGSSLELKM